MQPSNLIQRKTTSKQEEDTAPKSDQTERLQELAGGVSRRIKYNKSISEGSNTALSLV